MLALSDFFPDPLLQSVTNRHDFAGLLVFDKWTCYTNGRQREFHTVGTEAAVVLLERKEKARRESPGLSSH